MKQTRLTAAVATFLMLSGICGTVPQTDLPCFSAVTAYADTEGDFEYKVYETGSEDQYAVIEKYCGNDDTVVIPETFRGAPVTGIENDAFPDKTLLKKVTLPECLTWFTSECFRDCVNLEEVQLSTRTELITSDAFSGCRSLKTINLPETIGGIGSGTFKNCSSLTEIQIPPGISSVDDEAFACCESLKTISIPESVTYFGQNAFAGTAWLKDQQEKNPLVIVNNWVLDGSACKGNVVIPDGSEMIAAGAFQNNQALTGVTFPASMDRIENDAFRGCTGLTELTIPETLCSIWERAFQDCKKLESVFLPDELSSIGMEAFAGCTALKEIKLPQRLTEISIGTFSGCENLADIEFPSWEFTAGQDAFTGTAWLKKQQETDPCVVVSSTLIDVSACSGELILPDSVRRIGRNIFYKQNALTKVVFPATYTHLTEDLFYDCQMLQEVMFRAEAVRVIPRYLFYECERLRNITLPKNYYQIERNAFDYCDNLEFLYIPDTVIQIDEDAFHQCSNLILEGSKGSCAEQYAIENEIPFRIADFLTKPDLNGSGGVSQEDVRIMQTFLLQKSVPLSNWLDADLNSDGFVNAVDLTLLKQRVFRDERFSTKNG